MQIPHEIHENLNPMKITTHTVVELVKFAQDLKCNLSGCNLNFHGDIPPDPLALACVTVLLTRKSHTSSF